METVSFQQILDALLDNEAVFPEHFLNLFSDLGEEELGLLRGVWFDIPLQRRQALMENLAELGVQDTVLSFEELGRFSINDTDPIVRAFSLDILSEFEKIDLAELYMTLLKEDIDPEVRAAAANGLGRYVLAGEIDKIPSEILAEVEDCLIECSQTGATEIERQKALISLGYSSRPEVSVLIERAHNKSEKEWVAASLYAMGRSANDRWEKHVLKMLNHKFPVIRRAAAFAAGELEISQATARLLELLDDADDEVRSNTIWALAQIGGDGVRRKLEQLYDQSEDEQELLLIEDALSNLAFWDDGDLPLFDYSGRGEYRGNIFEDEDEWD